MTVELVAFDCDGVLVDTEPVVNRVFVELVGRTGPRLAVDATLARFRGVSMSERVLCVAAEHDWKVPNDFMDRFDEGQFRAFHTEVRAVPGAVAAVLAVKGPRAVVSNGTRDEMTVKLTRIGLLEAFAPHLYSASEVKHSKPAPDVYLHAAAGMGAAPASAIAIEDSPPGVQAAVAAGFSVFGYAGEGSGDALAHLGAHVFHDMSELPGLLRDRGVRVA